MVRRVQPSAVHNRSYAHRPHCLHYPLGQRHDHLAEGHDVRVTEAAPARVCCAGGTLVRRRRRVRFAELAKRRAGRARVIRLPDAGAAFEGSGLQHECRLHAVRLQRLVVVLARAQVCILVLRRALSQERRRVLLVLGFAVVVGLGEVVGATLGAARRASAVEITVVFEKGSSCFEWGSLANMSGRPPGTTRFGPRRGLR